MGTALFMSVVIASVLLIAFGFAFKSSEFRWNRLGQTMKMLGVLLALSPLYLEYATVPASTGHEASSVRVVSFDQNGNVDGISAWALPCWSRCAKVWLDTAGVSRVQPITENPKVRRLSYHLKLEIFNIEKFFASGVGKGAGSDVNENSEALQNAALYYLYQFNNYHSKELAQFYNPLDEVQHKVLEKMIRTYLDEHAGLDSKGIRMVRLERFEIE